MLSRRLDPDKTLVYPREGNNGFTTLAALGRRLNNLRQVLIICRNASVFVHAIKNFFISVHRPITHQVFWISFFGALVRVLVVFFSILFFNKFITQPLPRRARGLIEQR